MIKVEVKCVTPQDKASLQHGLMCDCHSARCSGRCLYLHPNQAADLRGFMSEEYEGKAVRP